MKSMTIDKKLFSAFGAALAVTLVIGCLSFQGFSSIGAQVTKLIRVNARKLYLAGDINTAMSDVISGERGILVRAFMKDYATIEKYKAQQTQTFARLKKDTDEFALLVETDEGRRLLNQVQQAQSAILQNHAEMTSLIDRHDTNAAVKVFVDKLMPLALNVSTVAEALAVQVNKLAERVGESVEGSVTQNRWLTSLLIGISIVVGIAIVLFVRQINRTLRQAVSELSEGAEQVAGAASQVAASSQSLAQGSSEQAASLEETSASTEEINSMATRNSENSSAAASLVTSSQQQFVETNHSLEQAVLAIGEINAQSG